MGQDDLVKSVDFYLNISSDAYLDYYRGQVKWVHVTSLCGKKVQFPANLLVNHITRDGVIGKYRLRYFASGKAIELIKL
ncbi:DUF2835 family protein [Aliikangiella maris]|uniref:DUF2835 family protein n=2 Tax=Aliikangiella maris TaxID=3162458 RepID=A0ABV3MRQ3_9GAMM